MGYARLFPDPAKAGAGKRSSSWTVLASSRSPKPAGSWRSRRPGRTQQTIKFLFPSAELRARLHLALIGKRRVLRPKNFPNCVAGHLQGAGDLLDRLALDKMLAPYPTDRLHNQHPPRPLRDKAGRRPNRISGGQFWTPIPRLIGGQSSTPDHIWPVPGRQPRPAPSTRRAHIAKGAQERAPAQPALPIGSLRSWLCQSSHAAPLEHERTRREEPNRYFSIRAPEQRRRE
jgi:hypothetical protein